MEPMIENRAVRIGSRSRTGCITCKIRRVKCDEAKPGCQRCKKFGRTCDGYAHKTAPTTQPRPKTSSMSQLKTRRPPPIILGENIPRSPVSSNFQDEHAAQYFQFFRYETASEIAGGVESTIWHRVVPQACYEEPCILHCTIALSALDRSCKSLNSSSSSDFELHHRYALQRYGQALNELRKVIVRGYTSIRTTFIASLLVFCFENLHGDLRLALTHIRSAIDLVHNWLSDQNNDSRTKLLRIAGSNAVEEELVHAFTCLEVHTTSWIGASPTSSHLPIADLIAPTSPGAMATCLIPDFFDSLGEASFHFKLLTKRIFRFLTTCGFRFSTQNPPTNFILSSSSEGARLGSELQKWQSAFEPILNTTLSQKERIENDDDKDFVEVCTLRMYSLVFYDALRSACYTLNMATTSTYPSSSSSPLPHCEYGKYEQRIHGVHLPQYREMVALCRAIITLPSFAKSFVFDIGVVPVLFAVVLKCNDSKLRHEALKLLNETGDRREGAWDARLVALMATELLSYEERDDEDKENEDHRTETGTGLEETRNLDRGSYNGLENEVKSPPKELVNVMLLCTGLRFRIPLNNKSRKEKGQWKDGFGENYKGKELAMLDWAELLLQARDGA